MLEVSREEMFNVPNWFLTMSQIMTNCQSFTSQFEFQGRTLKRWSFSHKRSCWFTAYKCLSSPDSWQVRCCCTQLATSEKGALCGVCEGDQTGQCQRPSVIGITTRDSTPIYRTIHIENEYVTLHRLNRWGSQKEGNAGTWCLQVVVIHCHLHIRYLCVFNLYIVTYPFSKYIPLTVGIWLYVHVLYTLVFIAHSTEREDIQWFNAFQILDAKWRLLCISAFLSWSCSARWSWPSIYIHSYLFLHCSNSHNCIHRHECIHALYGLP